MNRSLRVIISGGGTGGHVFPALSIARELKNTVPGVEILFVGAEGRMEMQKVPEAGFNIEGLPVRGFDRKNKLKNIPVIIQLVKSMKKARILIHRFSPDVVVGVGGYASGPMVRIAGRKRIPVLIQEQNSYAGVTNRWLASRASVICVAYEGMNKYFPPEKLVLSGNPVREEIGTSRVSPKEAYTFYGIPKGHKIILVLGGSLGAGTINQAILNHLDTIHDKPISLIWQTGKSYYVQIKKEMKNRSMPHVLVMDFIRRMDRVYAAATMIISRAGAGTLSELAVVGKPVILVPSPNVAEDHQTKNAMALVQHEAALMIADHDAEEHLLAEALTLLDDAQKMRVLSQNLKKMARPEASRDIVSEILKLAGKRK